jgi:lysophospholipase L1-like esterase
MTYRFDPRYGFAMRPSQRISTWGNPVEINSLGLRGPELLDPKPKDVLRVLFLGDSITYGGGKIPEKDLFVRRIETLAAQHSLRVEAVNVAVSGWSPANWSAWLEAHGLLDADALVAVIPEIDLARPFARPEQHHMVEEPPPLRLSIFYLKWVAARLPGVPLTDEALAENVRAVTRLVSGLGPTPLLAVFVPSRPGGDPHPERWAPYESLFPDALDLRGVLGAEDFFDDVHLSGPGHQAVAEHVYPRLESLLLRVTARRDSGAL